MADFPSRADGTVPPGGDSALDVLLTAGQPPQDTTAGLQPVAAVLAALRAGPADGELAGQARALAEFRSTVRVSHRAGRRWARHPAPFRERLSTKLAVITAATAVAVSGTIAAAYLGALPGPLQRAARDVIPGAAHGRPAPAAYGDRRLATPAPSAAAPSAPALPGPVTGYPGWRHGRAGPARKHYQRKRHGHHKVHPGLWAPHHEGTPGDRYDGGLAARPGDKPMARRPGNQYNDRPGARRHANPKALHKGSRLQSPLPRAAVFPTPPAGPGRPGVGGR